MTNIGHNIGALWLPKPPTQNACWRNAGGRKGRVRTDRYLTWLAAAKTYLDEQGGKARFGVAGTYIVDLTVEKFGNGDLDNFIKPTVDALVGWGVVPDDRHMTEVRARFAGKDTIKGIQVRVWSVMAREAA